MPATASESLMERIMVELETNKEATLVTVVAGVLELHEEETTKALASVDTFTKLIPVTVAT